MEQTQEATDAKKKPAKNKVLKKVDLATAKLLQQIKDKVNKKPYGRNVRDSDILGVGLQLIGSEDIKRMQEATLSEHDRLLIVHEEYQRVNGKLNLDQFIGKLLRGEIQKD